MANLPKNLKDNIADQRTRIAMKKGSIIVVAGQTGEGKTTFAVQIAEEFQEKYLDFEKYVAMGGSDFMEKRDACLTENADVIVYDEAGDLIGKRAMSKFNVDMVRDFELQRVFKLFVILCLPSFKSLDPSFYTERGLVRAVVQVYDRDDDKGHFGWYGRRKIGQMLKIMGNKHRCPDLIDDLYTPGNKHFIEPDTSGLFYDLPPERSRQLEEYSLQGKTNILKERNMKEKGYFTYKDLQQKTGKITNHLRKIIFDKNIQPVEKIGRIVFFDPDDVSFLFEEKKKTPKEDGD